MPCVILIMSDRYVCKYRQRIGISYADALGFFFGYAQNFGASFTRVLSFRIWALKLLSTLLGTRCLYSSYTTQACFCLIFTKCKNKLLFN
jgi:hypothetical protein